MKASSLGTGALCLLACVPLACGAAELTLSDAEQTLIVEDPTSRKTAEMEPAVRDAGLAYTVTCEEGAGSAKQCEVDLATYKGWRSFQTHCYQCHGGSGVGSTFAPNLQERFNDHVDYARFDYVMHNGYVGNMGAMPSFGENRPVLRELDPLYIYLRARADGALPPGRPTRAR